MKKLLMLMAVCSMALVFTSCEKDKDNNNNALAGTTWETSYAEEGGVFTVTGTFGVTSVTMVSKFVMDGDPPIYESSSVTANYTYEAPNVTISYVDDENITETIKGTVSGNKMTFTEAINGSTLVLTKK